MKNRLFLIEGLPCSGKSTTSKYIAKLLKKQQNNVVWIDEGTGNHPADYEFQSYITEEIYRTFDKEEQTKILEVSTKKHDGYIVELGQLKGELFDKVIPYKIYDCLEWDVEKEIMLDKWRAFVEQADEQTIYVFNCCFLQNPMCETMIRFGHDLERSRQYIESIAKIIEPMQPVCIYLKENRIKDKVAKVSKERGDKWLNSVIEYHTNGTYGKENGLVGFDGYISCLEERQKRELSILKGLDIDYLVVEQVAEHWNEAQVEIETFIKQLAEKRTYQFKVNQITAKEFERLEKAVGWGVPSLKQIEVALKYSLYIVGIYDEDVLVGMARLVGDIGMSYLIKDVVVLPQYQGKGIGRMLIQNVFDYIQKTSIPNTKVCVEVMSAVGKEAFYKTCGFNIRPDAKNGYGMMQMMEIKE